MKPEDSIKLLSEVRDLQIVDSEDANCGICDDIELEGKPGEPLRIAALLVGPGGYRDRLPHWAYWLITKLAGSRQVRVPWKAVDSVTSRIFLSKPGAELGLGVIERKLERKFPKHPSS